MLGHPAGAGEMGIVDMAGTAGVVIGIEFEQDGNDFAPVRAICFGIEQTQIKDHMRVIITCQFLTIWRCVLDSFVAHPDTHRLLIAASLPDVNHTGIEESE